MRVIGSTVEKRCTCQNCDSVLEYENADTHIGLYGLKYVKCPVCEAEVAVTEERVAPPTWGHTFVHTNKETAKQVNSATIQDMIDQCRKNMINLDYDYYFISYGDVFIFARRDDTNMIEIYVTRDWWTDAEVLP